MDLENSTSSGSSFEPLTMEEDSSLLTSAILKHYASYGIIDESVIAAVGENSEGLVDIISKQLAKSCDKVQLLQYAVRAGSLELVKALVGGVDDVNEKGEHESTALEIACKLGREDIVRVLLANGANANSQFKRDSLGVVQAACWRELYETADKLGAKEFAENILKSELEDKLNSGTISALAYACLSGSCEIVKMLIDHGADVNFTGNDGSSPLECACEKNQEKIVKLLLENLANAKTEFKSQLLSEKQSACWRELFKIAEDQGRSDIVEIILYGKKSLDDALSVENTRFERQSMSALVHACWQGHCKIAELLLRHGADVRGKSENNWAILALSLRKFGESKLVKLLLENRADPNTVFDNGQSVLQYCCSHRFYESADLLIQYGADVNFRSKNGWTVLEHACRQLDGSSRAKDIVDLLLKNGADPNDYFSNGALAVLSACLFKCHEVLESLILYGADLNLITNMSQSNALGFACHINRVDFAKVLLEKGADANSLVCGQYSALEHACKFGLYEMARILIEHGADANTRCSNGLTVLQWACEKNQHTIVNLLLQHGAEANVTFESLGAAEPELLVNCGVEDQSYNKNTVSALERACSLGLCEVATALIDHGADINFKTNNGKTALELACEMNHVKIAELLLQKGADANTVFTTGVSALEFTFFQGLNEIAKLLVINGADVNVTFKRGNNAISVACLQGLDEMVQLLIQRGADLKNKSRAIEVACEQNHENLVEILLKNGANANAMMEGGITSVLEYSCSFKLYNIVELLLKYGANPERRIASYYWKLCDAVTSNDYRLVELLLDHGANVNQIELFPSSNPIFAALRTESDEMVKFLLDRGFDINQEDHNGCTIVEEAVARQDDTLAKDLVKRVVKMILEDKLVSEKNLKAIRSNEELHAFQNDFTMEVELASACA